MYLYQISKETLCEYLCNESIVRYISISGIGQVPTNLIWTTNASKLVNNEYKMFDLLGFTSEGVLEFGIKIKTNFDSTIINSNVKFIRLSMIEIIEKLVVDNFPPQIDLRNLS